jgi:hypothetical protein
MSLYHLIPPGAGRPVDILEPQPVNFILRYRGPLTTSDSHLVDDKQAIREYLHPQLAELCRTQPFYERAQIPGLVQAELKGSVPANIPRGSKFYCVRLGGFEFVPLIHSPGEVVCQLDITRLRREEAGGIVVAGGDLDNRLKKLFDGLRMPHSDSEVGSRRPANESERRFCLLEDDKLITKLSVSTYQLLEPLQLDDKPGDVDLLLNVKVEPVVSDIAFRSSTVSAIGSAKSQGFFFGS